MKRFVSLFFILLMTAVAVVETSAQKREMTFILFRHAERFPSTKENNSDPELTEIGKQRAARLPELLRKYKPEQIFSTNLKRTIATVTPLADNLDPVYRIQIQKYSYDELEQFAGKLLALNARTVVIVGHNNTTPALANLLIKEEKYKQFADTEYDKMIVVKVKNGVGTAEMLTF